MSPALRARGLTKRYGTKAALTDATLTDATLTDATLTDATLTDATLTDATLTIPAGRVLGLVGSNGAGKSALLNLVAGTIRPTSGSIEMLGSRPVAGAVHLTRVGIVA